MIQNKSETKPKKIIVMLPVFYDGGTLRLVKNICKAVKRLSISFNDPIEIYFGNPEGSISLENNLSDLVSSGIKIRNIFWQVIDQHKAKNIAYNLLDKISFKSNLFLVPFDGVSYLSDFDHWFIITDRISHPLLPLKPYSIFATDFIQRYVPNIFPLDWYSNMNSPLFTFIRNIRNADYIFTSSQGTAEDCQTYVGRRNNIVSLPHLFDFSFIEKNFVSTSQNKKGNYFVWVTNSAPHKNHESTIRALAHYYQILGGQLDCIVLGSRSHVFDPAYIEKNENEKTHPYAYYYQNIRNLIGSLRIPKNKLIFEGDVADKDYIEFIRNAQFLFHNVIRDNGTFSVMEACYLKTPCLSSDYPQMREIDTQFELNLDFFNSFDPIDTAQSIKLMEEKVKAKNFDTITSTKFNKIFESSSEKYYLSMKEAIATGRSKDIYFV